MPSLHAAMSPAAPQGALGPVPHNNAGVASPSNGVLPHSNWESPPGRPHAQLATSSGHKSPLLDAIAIGDSRLDGWRARILATVAAVVVGTSFFNNTTYYVIAAIVLALVVCLLGAGRVLAFRADDGRWVVWRTLVTNTRLALDAIGDFWKAPFSEKARQICNVAALVGFMLLAIQPPIKWVMETLCEFIGERFVDSPFETLDYVLRSIGGISLAASVGFFVARRRSLQSHAAATGLGVGRAGNSLALAHDLRGLPAVLDLTRDRAAPRVADPLLNGVLASLAAWSPPRWCKREIEYERSLVRHLEKVLPEVRIHAQFPIANADGELRRLDVVIAKAIVLELKCALDAAASQRARGQIEDYLDMWTGGPVLLVVCETPAHFAETQLMGKVRALHSAGRPVLAIAAGRRLRR